MSAPNQGGASALNPVVDSHGYAICPECLTRVHCRSIGNLQKRHQGSEACKENKRKRDRQGGLKNGSILSWTVKKAPAAPVPSTAQAPAPLSHARAPASSMPAAEAVRPATATLQPRYVPAPFTSNLQTIPAVDSLSRRLQHLLDALPPVEAVREGTEILLDFLVDPQTRDVPGAAADELWEEGLNQFLKGVLGWNEAFDVPAAAQRGRRGLRGLVRYVEYFVEERGMSEGLWEGKLKELMDGLELLVQQATNAPMEAPGPLHDPKTLVAATESASGARKPPQDPPIDVDALDAVSKPQPCATIPCPGYAIDIPEDKVPDLVYPFGLHHKDSLPWGYEVFQSQMKLRANDCTRTSASATKPTPCRNCSSLSMSNSLQGIVRRAHDGVDPNSPYAYYGVGDLVRLLRKAKTQIASLKKRGLNQARSLASRSASLTDYKRFVVAIGSSRYEHVERLVCLSLRQKKGIKGMLSTYERAVRGVYHPKDYTEQDDMRGLLLWKLGGSRIAGIAHRALGLPHVSTLRNRQIMPPLVPSPSQPTTSEIQKNILACFESIYDALSQSRVRHMILMIDEIATEARVRWDEKTNMFLGVCRAHGHRTSLEFNTQDDLEELFGCLESGEVHHAKEATVGALGILSGDTRIYAGRPILVSGDCKKETGEEHAKVLQTVLTATEELKPQTKLRVVSIASDGESRRGTAFVGLTFRELLKPVSPIYHLLAPLTFMDLFVGEDDLTCDKDWKHVFKRIRNLLLRVRGVVIQGIRITPSVIETHLKMQGHSAAHVHALFNPNDHQDVQLAFSLLKDLWMLPSLPNHPNPSVTQAREALRVLGKLLYHVLFPYVCVDLSLSEQLAHLSAAAHLALALYHEGGSKFFPTLL